MQRPSLHRVERDHARRSCRRITDERLFAKRRAGAEHRQRDHIAVRRRRPHRDPTLLDEVEAVAGVALVEHRVALAERRPVMWADTDC